MDYTIIWHLASPNDQRGNPVLKDDAKFSYKVHPSAIIPKRAEKYRFEKTGKWYEVKRVTNGIIEDNETKEMGIAHYVFAELVDNPDEEKEFFGVL